MNNINRGLPPYLASIVRSIEKYGMRGWLLRELARSFEDARKNKRSTHNEHDFEIHWMQFIRNLTEAVMERIYHPSASIAFVVFDPKVREIFAAPFIDRVIHHFLFRMQSPWWDKRLIYDSYSCRLEKGTLMGAQRIHKMMQQATEGGTKEAMYIKLDLQGYFMSLDRKRLFEHIDKGLMAQYAPYFHNKAVYQLYELCRYLWRATIMDDPAKKGRRRGPRKNWDLLPRYKSLFTQEQNLGIVIGNLTSQLISNIYLDQLDRYVKFELGYKYYGRYVDDFIIIVPKEKYKQAKRDVPKIEAYLESLHLTLHKDKRQMQSVYKGLTFLGIRVTPFCMYPSARIQRHFEGAVKGLRTGRTQDATLNSYLGLLVHLDADKYASRVFTKYGIDAALWKEWCLPRKQLTRRKSAIIAEMRAQAEKCYRQNKTD
ncbi:RNA-directed DNA polymerase [Candidatus Saccharibacteria bacterium]|nr:RNA-directed DNA polymerase [Candidatus Saccharibacteria bacterium]